MSYLCSLCVCAFTVRSLLVSPSLRRLCKCALCFRRWQSGIEKSVNGNAFCMEISQEEGARINIHTLHKWMWIGTIKTAPRTSHMHKPMPMPTAYGWEMMLLMMTTTTATTTTIPTSASVKIHSCTQSEWKFMGSRWWCIPNLSGSISRKHVVDTQNELNLSN